MIVLVSTPLSCSVTTASTPSPLIRISPTLDDQSCSRFHTEFASVPGIETLMLPWFSAASFRGVSVLSVSNSGVSAASASVPMMRSFSFNRRSRASTPTPPDRSKGYVWGVFAGFDIFEATDTGKIEKRLTDAPGYDAEATASYKTGTIVYTSLASGDLDLWTMKADERRVGEECRSRWS